MMATIPIKLNKVEVSKIDYLVKLGKYKSRNQAIRSFIEISLLQESINLEEDNPDIEKIKNKLYQLWDLQPEFNLTTDSNKSLVDLVSQDRMR
jgi:Arc/MetJ-type ribon-helix-helix transcriptional regulator